MTTYLKDYKPTNFDVVSIYLEFDIAQDFVIVKNTSIFNRKSAGALHLHGDELELISIKLDGAPLQGVNVVDDGLLIDTELDNFTLEIITRLEPQKNTKLAGLFKTNSILCTQCEAHGFRRITYFYDRPDVLTTYTTKIIADQTLFPVLLSNGNLIASGNLADNKHYTVWEDPFKKPAYLFALVAGDLAYIQNNFTTKSGKTVDLRIYVEHKDIHKCAHAMDSLQKAMRWDEEVYGLEYDLATFMIVAVSDFNMGAMENKGLNIFNSKFILATKESATDNDFADIEGVVAHEYFHNWTGNRVTCRDWFQLSLKEGLTVFRDQEFSRDMNSRAVNRIQDVRILRSAQFPEDAGAMAHPVRPTAYQEVNNFYTATVYNKGAEIIRMQHTLLGTEGFRRGMDLYFHRHDGQAVTIDDFVAAMEDANNKDLTQFKYWYDKPGTPVVQVESNFKDNTLTLTFTQSCRATNDKIAVKPFHIPIKYALFSPTGDMITSGVIELKEFNQKFTFPNLPTKPTISLLRDFSAPIILKTDNNANDLQNILKFETDGFAKWDAAQTLTKQFLIANYHNPNLSIPQDLLNCLQHVLTDANLDAALRAEILTLPSFEDLANEIANIDVAHALNIRESFKAELAQCLYNDATKIYQQLWLEENHSMQSEAFGPRKLRNICLQYMFTHDERKNTPFCTEQFNSAQTMTDKLASLMLLAKSKDLTIKNQALQSFYTEWHTDNLVLDKWFTVQAITDCEDALLKVQELVNHKDFTLTNPNRVRSLIAAFCQTNHRNFHALDGSGYKFLTSMLLKIDKINPQLSSRLATPFTRWQRLHKNYQDLMLNELKLLNQERLSVDLNELVVKSLAAV